MEDNLTRLNEISDKKILVTGADGFVASHLVERLVDLGGEVIGLLRRDSFGTFKNLNSIKNKIHIKWGDAQDLSLVNEISKDVDIIYHLAAQSHVGYSIYNPYETVTNDIISTLNMLEASRKNNISKLIHAGSSEIYGKPDYTPIDENHPLKPRSPYAAAKASAENLLQSYYDTYNIPVVFSRFFNIFGPRQGLDQAIPKFILQAINNKDITIYGDGNQSRDYTYVNDSVEAYCLLAVTKDIEGKIMNFGSGIETKIKDIAKSIVDLTNSKSQIIFDNKLRSAETPKLLCDTKEAKRVINWESKISFEQGLKNTIEFFKDKKELYANLSFMT